MTHPTVTQADIGWATSAAQHLCAEADRDAAIRLLAGTFARHRTAAEAANRAMIIQLGENAAKAAKEYAANMAANREEVERLRHIATDLLQHIDWLTKGLPALLGSGGLADEEGLIGAAVDAAASARAALSPTGKGEGGNG